MKIVKPHSKFFIIGNADEQHNISDLISDDDIVVRFNAPNPSCSLKADWAFIANGYTQIRHLNIMSHDLFKPDMQIFFRYTISDIWNCRYQNIPFHKRVKYRWRFPKWIEHFQLDRYIINTIPESITNHCIDILNFRQPSTGLLAISYILQNYGNHTIYVHNFTNEGWVGHNWSDEKRLMENWLKEKKIHSIRYQK